MPIRGPDCLPFDSDVVQLAIKRALVDLSFVTLVKQAMDSLELLHWRRIGPFFKHKLGNA